MKLMKEKNSLVHKLCTEADLEFLEICQWVEDVCEKYNCDVMIPLLLLEGRIKEGLDSLE